VVLWLAMSKFPAEDSHQKLTDKMFTIEKFTDQITDLSLTNQQIIDQKMV